MKRALILTLCLLTQLVHGSSKPVNDASNAVLFTVVYLATVYTALEGLPRAISWLQHCFSSTKPSKDSWVGPLPRQLRQAIDLHKHASRFQRFNLEPNRGYLLYGPPGTGKTLLAEHLARIMKIPLIKDTSGNFLTMWQGSGNAHLAELISRAHRYSQPKTGYFRCILFIDEIDGICSREQSGNREELRLSEHLLTAITAPENNSILFLGATNIFNSVDQALVRPGRLTPVYVGYPEAPARKALFEWYFKKHKVKAYTAPMDALAEKTAGLSSAAIRNAIECALYHRLTCPNISFGTCLEHALDEERRHPHVTPTGRSA